MSQIGYGIPIESTGYLPVSIQDQTTEPIDALFNQSISNFTLDADTVESTDIVLNYEFEAAGGHGIAPSDEVLLLDVIADRVLQAVVISVVTNTITIDRPIDHAFPSATTLGRIVTSEMAVVGSLAVPQIYTFRAGVMPVDAVRFLLTMTHTTAATDDQFGGITALTNGLVFRIYNGLHKTTFNFKSNRDIRQFCYDVNYSDKAGPSLHGTSSRISFGGQDKHGVVLRTSGDSVIQWVVQDDLTGLTSLVASVQGHIVTE